MARNDVVNSDGSINFNTIGGFKDRLDGHDSSLSDIATNVKSKGAKGDGTTDSTSAFSSAITSNARVIVPPGTYLISNLVLSNLSNVHIIGIGNPTIKGTDNTKKIFDFESCTNVRLEGFSIGYQTTPTSRTDNIEPILFNQCTNTFVEKVEVFNSQSVGIIHVYCNNPTVRDCYVHDTLADGINFSHCGRNVKVLNNILENTGDDSIAVYFFQSATPSLVGEPDNFTKRPVIQGNIVKNGQARGIMIGGTIGAVINGNTVENTRAYGITAHYESSGVNYNTDFVISNNVVRNPAQNGTDPNGQFDGIYVAQNNVRGSITGNEIYNAHAAGIHCLSNASIKNNRIDTAQQGAYLGDWSTSVSQGEFSQNTVSNTTLEGVYIAPRSTVGWKIKANEFTNCVLPANVGTGSGKSPSVIHCEVSGGLSVTDNTFVDTQSSQTLNSAVYFNNFGGAVVERNTLRVSSGFSRGMLDMTSSANISNPHIERFNAIPSFGFWTIGDEIQNTSPSLQGTAGSQYIIDGWKRITTGTGNVINTDWVQKRITTGT